jgi:hypothetical protein
MTITPPEMPSRTQPTTMSGLIQQVRDETGVVERSLAGYTHLMTLLTQVQGGKSAGERTKGPPILSYRASHDGINVVEVRADTGKLDPQSLGTLLVPLANIHAQELLEALELMEGCVSMMLQQVRAAMGYPAAATQPRQQPVPVRQPQPLPEDELEESYEDYQALQDEQPVAQQTYPAYPTTPALPTGHPGYLPVTGGPVPPQPNRFGG